MTALTTTGLIIGRDPELVQFSKSDLTHKITNGQQLTLVFVHERYQQAKQMLLGWQSSVGGESFLLFQFFEWVFVVTIPWNVCLTFQIWISKGFVCPNDSLSSYPSAQGFPNCGEHPPGGA